MESDNLKWLPAPDDSACDAWLQANSSLPALADAGFSRRVLRTLPRTRRRRPFRAWIAGTGLAAGIGLALLGAGVAAEGVTAIEAFNAHLIRAVELLLDPAVAGALLLTAGSVWFAFRDRWRPGWTKRV